MFWHFFHQIHFFSVFFRRVLIFPYCIYIVVLLSEAYLEHYLETYFNLRMIYMAVFDWITLVRLKEILTLNSVEVSSNPNSTPLFVIVFWGETNRSSLSQMFFKIGVLKNFANFIGKHQCWSLFLIKLQAWRPATLLKRDSNTGVFLWNLRNSKEHLFLQNTSGGCFWANPGDVCGSLSGEVVLWSFSTSLS